MYPTVHQFVLVTVIYDIDPEMRTFYFSYIYLILPLSLILYIKCNTVRIIVLLCITLSMSLIIVIDTLCMPLMQKITKCSVYIIVRERLWVYGMYRMYRVRAQSDHTHATRLLCEFDDIKRII